jgi:uncharacterized protein (DUF1778 family)
MVDRRRERNLNFRVSEEEADMLKALAERQGLSASDFLRQYIRRAFAETFPPKKKR